MYCAVESKYGYLVVTEVTDDGDVSVYIIPS